MRRAGPDGGAFIRCIPHRVISTYSRAQALEDGVLVDAGPLAKEAGFRWPVAITAAAWEDCYYNLVRPHKSLRLPVADASPRKWLQQTPAMAAKLTDHIWTVKELLKTVVPPLLNNT